MIKNWTIYKIVSPSGRVYVGVTCNYKRRMSDYRTVRFRSQPLLKNSFNKYGFEKHTISVVETVDGNINQALSLEMFWIRSYMSNNCKWPEIGGLNLTNGGQGTIGYRFSEEKKRIISEHVKEHIRINGCYNLGKKISEVQKQQIREYNITNQTHIRLNNGHRSKERLQKMVATRKRNGTWGHSDSTRQKISTSQKSKKISQFTLGGEYLASFENGRDAHMKLGIPKSTIIAIANGASKKPRTFLFKYTQ